MKPLKSGPSILSSAMRDFDQASAIITSAAASAAGWDAAIHDPRAAAQRSVLIYVWDLAADWTWVCSTPCEVFTKLSEAASGQSPKGVESIRGCLGESIWRAATGKRGDMAPNVIWV